MHSGDTRALGHGAISNPVILDGVPALDNVSVLQCMLGGTITILYPGETTEMIPSGHARFRRGGRRRPNLGVAAFGEADPGFDARR